MTERRATVLRLTWTEIKLFVREPLTVVFTFAFPVMVLVVLAAAFGTAPAEEGVFRGVPAMDYYVPGYVGLVIASVGLIALPVHLASYREQGVLRRFAASGVPASAVLGAQVIVSLLVETAGGAVLVALGFAAYDVRVPESILGVVAAFVLSAVSFSAIGFLLGALMPTARAAQGLGLILFFVMMFLSGTDGPREVLGETLRRIGDFLPLTHVITALQDPWIGFGWNPAELVLIGAMAVVAALVSVRGLRAA